MDIVKYGRVKVKVGDCVSVNSNYFGASFDEKMRNLGFEDGRIYGGRERDGRERDGRVTAFAQSS